MRIIAFIHDVEPVDAILKHLKLWEYPRRAPPKKVPLPVQQLLFPRREQPYRYPTRDNVEARMAPELMAAESWGEYHAEPVPIEAYAIDPPSRLSFTRSLHPSIPPSNTPLSKKIWTRA